MDNHEMLERIKYSIENRGVTYEKCADLISCVMSGDADGTLSGDEVVRWCRYARSKLMEIRTEEAYGQIYECYRIAGQYNFDDYMSACEFYREPQARFWWPRRKVLEGKHRIATQIQEFMDDPTTRYLGFSAPPGIGKSTLIKFLLAYIAGRWPESANMYVSYSDGMVKMILDSEKDILTNKNEYKHNEIFHNGRPAISSEYKTLSYRMKGDFPTLGLVALGGSVTGRTRANKFLITDDLVKNAEEARSPERLEKLYADYKATLTTRMIGDDVKQIQLGTIWSVHDPISRMKAEHEGDPRYRFIALPVCDEEGHSNFLYDHPDNYTDEKIAEIRASMDPVDFSCLYMQQGIQKEGLAFRPDEMRYYNGVLPPVEPDKKTFFCDVAFGGGDSLAQVFAYVYQDDIFIPDVVFNKGAKDETQPVVAGRIMRHKCHTGRFEANNGGDFYADDIDQALRADGYHMNITTAKAPTTMSKEARIEQYAPDIKKFVFLEPKMQSEEYKRFMAEVFSFSFTAKNIHDDAPDSLAGLAAMLVEKPKVVTSPFKRW